VQYNHDRLIIVKRRPEKCSLQHATERRQRRCIRDAGSKAIGKAPSPSVERLVDGTTSMIESEHRRRRVSTLDVRCRLRKSCASNGRIWTQRTESYVQHTPIMMNIIGPKTLCFSKFKRSLQGRPTATGTKMSNDWAAFDFLHI